MSNTLKVKKGINVVGDEFAVVHRVSHADMQKLRRQNHAIRQANGKGIPRINGHIQGGVGRRAIGEIDPVTFMRLEAEGILSDEKKLREWLNNPDNADFKLVEGSV